VEQGISSGPIARIIPRHPNGTDGNEMFDCPRDGVAVAPRKASDLRVLGVRLTLVRNVGKRQMDEKDRT